MKRTSSTLPSWPVLIGILGAGTTMFVAMALIAGSMALARRFVGAKGHS